MNCEKTLNLIDDLVEGELNEQTAARVDSHVFACAECRERYEILRREREIYAHYLFDAEPSSDLWTNFQAKLETETEKTPPFAKMPARVNARRTSLFGFWLWSPALAGAALLVVFGIGSAWLKFAPNESSGDEYTVKTESGDLRLPEKSGEIDEGKAANSPVKTKSGANNTTTRNNKLNGKSESFKAKRVFAADKKFIAAEAVKIGQKAVSATAEKIPANGKQLNGEERLQKLRMNNLEKEIAGQIEKVEMLLRSFRNARAIESTEIFDVGYEKEQARKLLEKNVRLRRDAESYEIAYAEELLGRVEPYLLDIANLENNPAPDKVLDIKERVKNQSIIASLQIY